MHQTGLKQGENSNTQTVEMSEISIHFHMTVSYDIQINIFKKLTNNHDVTFCSMNNLNQKFKYWDSLQKSKSLKCSTLLYIILISCDQKNCT